jgi:hypothetical protein
MLLGGLNDGPEPLQALCNRAVDVLLRERFRRRAEHRDLFGASGKSRFKALHIRDQDRVGHPGMPFDLTQNLGVIGHLRHPFLGHEGCCLNGGEPGKGEALDQPQFVLGRDRPGLVLKSVPRPNFNNSDLFRQLTWHGCFTPQRYGESQRVTGRARGLLISPRCAVLA